MDTSPKIKITVGTQAGWRIKGSDPVHYATATEQDWITLAEHLLAASKYNDFNEHARAAWRAGHPPLSAQ